MTEEIIKRKVQELIGSITDRPVVVLVGVDIGVETFGNCASSMSKNQFLLLRAFMTALDQYGRGMGNPRSDISRN